MIRNSANLATNFQDLVAKMKHLVALPPVLGTIVRPSKSFFKTKFEGSEVSGSEFSGSEI